MVRILYLLRGYQYDVFISIIANILLSFFTVVSIPLLIPFFQILFDRTPELIPLAKNAGLNDQLKHYFAKLVLENGKLYALSIICSTIVLVFFFKNFFRYMASYFMATVRNGVVYDLRSQLFQKYLDLPISYYADEKKGNLISKAISDVQEIEVSIVNVLDSIFKSPLVMLGCIIFMLYTSINLSIFVLVLLIFTAVIIGGIGKNLKKTSSEVQTRLGTLSSIIEETLSGLRVIKSFNAEEFQTAKFDEENKGYNTLLTKLLRRRDLSIPLSEFLGISVVAILLWYGARLVFINELSPETFFAFVFAFYQVVEPAKSFTSAYYNIQKGRASLERIDEVLAIDSAIVETKNPIKIGSFKENIELANVSFKYPKAEQYAIDNLSLTINKGETVAFVGTSGGGKSTLADLLIRFHDVSKGSIKMDGIDIKSLKTSELRSLYGVVTQEAILFNDTIANNISFGQTEFTKEMIIEAAKVANAHDFISNTLLGYETNIGDRGMKLSGGQKQRLTIARAILRNPPILILDEATSALDAESEYLVQESIDRLMKNRTSIVIAHRLSTIKKADRIYVLEDGKITETGNHEQLMTNRGTYFKLVEMQTFE